MEEIEATSLGIEGENVKLRNVRQIYFQIHILIGATLPPSTFLTSLHFFSLEGNLALSCT